MTAPPATWWAVLSAASANLGVKVAGAGLSLAVAMSLGRWLGPDGYGVYAWALTMAQVLAVFATLGFPNVLVRDVAVATDNHDGPAFVGLTRFAERLATRTAAVLGVLTVVVAMWLGVEMVSLVTLALAMGLLLTLAQTDVHRAVLRGQHRVVAATVPHDLVRPLVLLLGVGALWVWAEPWPDRAMAVHVGAGVVAVGVLMGLRRHHHPAWAGDVSPTHRPRVWMRAALSMLALSSLATVARHIDVLALKALADLDQVGVYAAAAQIAGLSLFVLQAMNLVITPRFASRYAAGDRAGLQRVASMGAATVGVTTVPLAVALIVLAGPLLSLFGPGFEAGWATLWVLVLGFVINALSGSVGFLLAMTGREAIMAVVMAVGCVLNVALDILLVPGWGALGAAVGTAVTMVLWNGVLLLAVIRELDVDPTLLGAIRHGVR